MDTPYSEDALKLKSILDAIVGLNNRAEIHHQDIRELIARPEKLWKLMEALGFDINDYQAERDLKAYLKEFAKVMPEQLKHLPPQP